MTGLTRWCQPGQEKTRGGVGGPECPRVGEEAVLARWPLQAAQNWGVQRPAAPGFCPLSLWKGGGLLSLGNDFSATRIRLTSQEWRGHLAGSPELQGERRYAAHGWWVIKVLLAAGEGTMALRPHPGSSWGSGTPAPQAAISPHLGYVSSVSVSIFILFYYWGYLWFTVFIMSISPLRALRFKEALGRGIYQWRGYPEARGGHSPGRGGRADSSVISLASTLPSRMEPSCSQGQGPELLSETLSFGLTMLRGAVIPWQIPQDTDVFVSTWGIE